MTHVYLMFSFLLWQLGCCLFKELQDPDVLMLLLPSGIFFLADWSPLLTMSSDASGKGTHAETQIMSSLAFDNFTLSAVQISHPDKLSLMPVLWTLNQMLGCSLQSFHSELGMSQAAQWWDKSVLPVGLFVLMALSQDKGLCLQAKAGNFVHSIRGLRRDKESLVKEK